MPTEKLDIFQIAYFVEDLENAATDWHRTSGAGPFFAVPHHKTDRFSYRGQSIEADVSYAFGYLGGMQIQLIQQHDEQPSIYRDMFPSGHGLHHLGSLVPYFQGARQRMLDNGHELACEIDADGVHACYFDTRPSIGCFTELHSMHPMIDATFARWRQAHERWDGTGPALKHPRPRD